MEEILNTVNPLLLTEIKKSEAIKTQIVNPEDQKKFEILILNLKKAVAV
jgi:hypothetical protein